MQHGIHCCTVLLHEQEVLFKAQVLWLPTPEEFAGAMYDIHCVVFRIMVP